MSPRSSTLLALIGVLLAGIPLPALTSARRGEATATPADPTSARHDSAPGPTATQRAYLTLTCSGSPSELRLLHEGRELARLGADELAEGWSSELNLPTNRPVALEVLATWEESTARQAVTLTLEPEAAPAQNETQWSERGSNTLHSLYIFPW